MQSRALITLVLLCAIAWLVFRWSANGGVWLVYDDSFYYFTIARNIARGAGSTFDGVHPTNGYHPLWLLACIVPYALGLSDDVSVKVLLTLCVIGLGASALVSLRTTNSAPLLARIAFVAFLFSPYAFVHFSNGLESTCVLLFFALLLERVNALGDAIWTERRTRMQVSLLACALFLSRTDAIFLVPWLAGFAFWKTRKVRATLEVALAPAIVIALYLVFNKIVFGTFTQVSGDLKRVIPSATGILSAIAIAGAPLAIFWILSRIKLEILKDTSLFFTRTAPLAGWALSIVAYYEHMQRFAWPWYFVVPIYYAAVAITIAMGDLARLRVGKILSFAIAGLVLLACANMVRVIGVKEQYGVAETNVVAGRWIREHMPEQGVYASWDSGAIGYYSHRTVINLDGEVAPPEYIRALKAGDPKIWTRQIHFDYLVNVQDADDGPALMKKTAASYLGDDRVEGATVVQEWPFTFQGYTNRHEPGIHSMTVLLMKLP